MLAAHGLLLNKMLSIHEQISPPKPKIKTLPFLILFHFYVVLSLLNLFNFNGSVIFVKHLLIEYFFLTSLKTNYNYYACVAIKIL